MFVLTELCYLFKDKPYLGKRSLVMSSEQGLTHGPSEFLQMLV